MRLSFSYNLLLLYYPFQHMLFVGFGEGEVLRVRGRLSIVLVRAEGLEPPTH